MTGVSSDRHEFLKQAMLSLPQMPTDAQKAAEVLKENDRKATGPAHGQALANQGKAGATRRTMQLAATERLIAEENSPTGNAAAKHQAQISTLAGTEPEIMKEKIRHAAGRLLCVSRVVSLRKRSSASAQTRDRGRVSRAIAHFSGNDWLSQTLLKHYLASIIQAYWKGMRTRLWFRSMVAEQMGRNKEYSKRLATIGRGTKPQLAQQEQGVGGEGEKPRTPVKSDAHKHDALSRQLRDEEEREAIANIMCARTQKLGPMRHATFSDLQRLGQRYTRQGMDRAASGAQYQDMTKNVIVTGVSKGLRRKSGAVIDIPAPRGLSYNPFAEPVLYSPEEKARRAKVAGEAEAERRRIAALTETELEAENCGNDKLAPQGYAGPRGASGDDSSDWSDCDAEDFGAMTVSVFIPEWMATESSEATGQLERMLVGRGARMDSSSCSDLNRRLADLHERNHDIHMLHTPPFDPEQHDLPDDLVHSLLLNRRADTWLPA